MPFPDVRLRLMGDDLKSLGFCTEAFEIAEKGSEAVG